MLPFILGYVVKKNILIILINYNKIKEKYKIKGRGLRVSPGTFFTWLVDPTVSPTPIIFILLFVHSSSSSLHLPH